MRTATDRATIDRLLHMLTDVPQVQDIGVDISMLTGQTPAPCTQPETETPTVIAPAPAMATPAQEPTSTPPSAQPPPPPVNAHMLPRSPAHQQRSLAPDLAAQSAASKSRRPPHPDPRLWPLPREPGHIYMHADGQASGLGLGLRLQPHQLLGPTLAIIPPQRQQANQIFEAQASATETSTEAPPGPLRQVHLATG